jgi:uncharacterized membrane protein
VSITTKLIFVIVIVIVVIVLIISCVRITLAVKNIKNDNNANTMMMTRITKKKIEGGEIGTCTVVDEHIARAIVKMLAKGNKPVVSNQQLPSFSFA